MRASRTGNRRAFRPNDRARKRGRLGCRGTNAAVVGAVLDRLGLPYTLVDEYETTLRARARYFADHPPRGWKRLVPRGMLLPERPVDDYAALLIAERYLEGRASP